MALAIVQHKSQINGSAVPGTFTITSTPTVGNWIIAFIGMNVTASSVTVNTTDWTILRDGRDETDGTNYQLTLVRKVQVGDTSTLPAFCTAGTTYSSYLVYEISGGSSTLKDFVLGSFYHSVHLTETALPLSEMLCPVNGVLALVGANRYNGSSNPSIASGWTNDEAQNNSGNFGSVGGWHASYNDGDAISGALTLPVTNNPGAWHMLLLGDGTQPTRPFIRQISRGRTQATGFTPTNTINMGTDPRDGSLILAFSQRERGNVATPSLGASWTVLTHADGATGAQVQAAYFYASGTSGRALPQLYSAGSNAFSEYLFFEITPVTGTIGTDVVFADSARAASGTSLTTTSRSTNANNELAIVVAHNYNASVLPSLSGSLKPLIQYLDSGDYGTIQVGTKEIASSGTSFSSTVTYSTSDAQGWAQLIIRGAGALVNYSLTVDETGYTYTPQSVAFAADNHFNLSNQSYAYTAENVGLNRGFVFSIGNASYAYTAENVAYKRTYVLGLTNASYVVFPQDFLLTPSFKRHYSFAELRREDFQDWGDTEFVSFFNACQSLDSPDLKTQTPWVYTFTKAGDNVGATMQVQWDWHGATQPDPRVQPDLSIYKAPPNAHYMLSVAKTKVRGKGRQVHVKYTSEEGKDFNILGWVVFYDTQAQQ